MGVLFVSYFVCPLLDGAVKTQEPTGRLGGLSRSAHRRGEYTVDTRVEHTLTHRLRLELSTFQKGVGGVVGLAVSDYV